MGRAVMMEKRWSTRVPVNLDVALRYDALGILRGRARDLSLEGMFIDTGRVMLPYHAALEINFAMPDGDHRRLHAVPAVVVRTSNGGVGAMFRNIPVDTARALKSVMQRSEAPVRPGG
jgi:hypothetical protein